MITAPAGIGKTLSSFLSIIDELFILGEKKELEDFIYCVYISPLKALDKETGALNFGRIKELSF
ncbi:MAG: hypothetical protein QXP77_02675 [Candidatus Aenigmatarchaeota archaeon]